MKTISAFLFAVLLLISPIVVTAQHNLSFDAAGNRRGVIEGNPTWASPSVNTFLLPPSAGTLLVEPSGASPALVWLTGGNTLSLGQVLGSVSNHDVVMVANSAPRMTLHAAGGVSLADAGVSINGVSYSFPNAQGGSSTVLQNDGSGNLSWATVSGTGGIGTLTFVRKTADQTFTTTNTDADTTLINATSMSFSIGANEVWEVEGTLALSVSHGAANLRYRFDGPSGCNVFVHSEAYFESPAGGFNTNLSGLSAIRAANDFGKHDMELNGSRRNWVHIKGYFANGGNSGTVQLKFATDDIQPSNRDLNMLTGSYLLMTRVQ